MSVKIITAGREVHNGAGGEARVLNARGKMPAPGFIDDHVSQMAKKFGAM